VSIIRSEQCVVHRYILYSVICWKQMSCWL